MPTPGCAGGPRGGSGIEPATHETGENPSKILREKKNGLKFFWGCFLRQNLPKEGDLKSNGIAVVLELHS